MENRLYYGDNLAVLRESVPDHSVDLIYLDPPFNSNAVYNILFKTPTGKASQAQAEAFQDTWLWGPSAEVAFDDVMSRGGPAARLLSALYSAFGKADIMAYLAMMTVRLEELARKLKPTGSLFLHCDPTASHYLKIILDGIFGVDCFRNEIIWKRTTAHNDAKRRLGDIHDCVLYYAKSDRAIFHRQFGNYDPDYVAGKYRHTDRTGRRYRLSDLRSPSPRPNLMYEYKGYKPHPNGWAVSYDKMEEFDRQGLLEFPRKPSGRIQFKRYLDERSGMPISSLWDDIRPINSMAKERLGYPTQKPLALLERIVRMASDEDALILDPFCGCGTTVEAAEALRRRWIGIDVTHYAISLIEARLRKRFPNTDVEVDGRPDDYAGALDLANRSEYQFQWWVNWLLQVQNYTERKRGPDGGIDGTIFFPNGPRGVGRALVSVKAGKNVGVGMVRELLGTMTGEEAEMGVLVTLHEPTQPMRNEAQRAGIVKTAPGTFPKLQVLWIKEWFDGQRPALPRPFEPQNLRAAVRPPKAGQDRQLGFAFTIPGGKGKRKKEVVYTDPRFALSD